MTGGDIGRAVTCGNATSSTICPIGHGLSAGSRPRAVVTVRVEHLLERVHGRLLNA